jgi:hypothetical protein
MAVVLAAPTTLAPRPSMPAGPSLEKPLAVGLAMVAVPCRRSLEQACLLQLTVFEPKQIWCIKIVLYILYYILFLCGSFLLKAFKTMMYEVHCSMTATLKHLKSHKLQPIDFLCWDHDT